MLILKIIKIRSYEIGLRFREGEFQGLLQQGNYWRFDPFGRVAGFFEQFAPGGLGVGLIAAARLVTDDARR